MTLRLIDKDIKDDVDEDNDEDIVGIDDVDEDKDVKDDVDEDSDEDIVGNYLRRRRARGR